jgi:hypothetical protein
LVLPPAEKAELEGGGFLLANTAKFPEQDLEGDVGKEKLKRRYVLTSILLVILISWLFICQLF